MKLQKEDRQSATIFIKKELYQRFRQKYGRDTSKAIEAAMEHFLDQTTEITDETTFNPEVVNPFQRKRSKPNLEQPTEITDILAIRPKRSRPSADFFENQS